MKLQIPVLLAGSSLFALAMPASAHDLAGAISTGSPALVAAAQQSASAVADNGAGDQEVVVTARRRDELLQDVPQSIAVVTGEELNKYSLKSFEDIDQLVPGMDLAPSTQGSLALTTFRGASYSAQTSTTNVVAFYANDAPVEANQIMQTTFDLGQVEVLRGTQGTLRGQSAPSGAITATLRRPNLSEYGAYINSTFQDDGDINLQGAVNVPLIHDVLGLRVAGVTDQNDVNGVTSVNNGLDPKSVTDGFRGTLGFEPTDNFHANLTYQRLRRTAQSFGQVEGGPGLFGDPAISSEDRRAVQDDPNFLDLKSELAIGNADLDVGPATLSFVGSWSDNRNRSLTDSDVGDTAAVDGHQAVDTSAAGKTAEVRLTSNAPVFGFMDYTFGTFYSHGDITTNVFTSGISLSSSSATEERSLYGNLDFHLGSKTDLAIGGRYLEQDEDVFQAAFAIVPEVNDHLRFRHTLWTAVLNHHFTDDLMGYVSAGTAARFTSPGILGLSFIGSDFTGPSAELLNYTNLPPEYSTNYEIGLKGEFLNRRLLTNVAVFHQKFDNFIFLDQDIAYFNDGPFAPFLGGLHAATFTVAAPALIDGVDFDATYRVLPNWTVSGSVSYADAHLDNANVPCNTVTAPDVNDVVKTCTSSGPISAVPNWSLTLQSEYDHPISENTEAFLRGFVNYAPENKNGSNPNFTADAYSLVNLFAGLRSPNGAWEVSVFAKNAFDQKTELSRAVNPASAGSTYFNTTFTPPRVFGVSLSYALGSF